MDEEHKVEYIINIQQNQSLKPNFIYHKRYFSVAHVPPPRPTTPPVHPIVNFYVCMEKVLLPIFVIIFTTVALTIVGGGLYVVYNLYTLYTP